MTPEDTFTRRPEVDGEVASEEPVEGAGVALLGVAEGSDAFAVNVGAGRLFAVGGGDDDRRWAKGTAAECFDGR